MIPRSRFIAPVLAGFLAGAPSLTAQSIDAFSKAKALDYPQYSSGEPNGHEIVISLGESIPTLAFQWRNAGIDVLGAPSASYTITNAHLADAVVFNVVAANLVGTALQSPIPIGNIPANWVICI